jgi:3-dehydroquinate dehydratase
LATSISITDALQQAQLRVIDVEVADVMDNLQIGE